MKQILLGVLTVTALGLGAGAQASPAKPQAKPSYQVLDAYPLATCVVSGKALDPKGTTTVQAGGLTFKVCSAECGKKVTAAPEEFAKKLDAARIAAQAPTYALATCPISGEKLEDGKGKQVVIDGTMVHFCCAKCATKAADKDKKAEVLTKVRDAAYAAQAKAYPLDKCPVSGDEIKKGETTDVLVGTRLVRLCCEDCIKDLQADPAKVLAKLPAPAGKGAPKEGTGACCGDGAKKGDCCGGDGEKKKEGSCCDEKKEGEKNEGDAPKKGADVK